MWGKVFPKKKATAHFRRQKRHQTATAICDYCHYYYYFGGFIAYNWDEQYYYNFYKF